MLDKEFGIEMWIDRNTCEFRSSSLIKDGNSPVYSCSMNSLELPLGTLLIEFIDTDFNNKEGFIEFVEKYGLGCIKEADISKSINNLFIYGTPSSISCDEYSKLLSAAWDESKDLLIEAQQDYRKAVFFCLDLDRDNTNNITPQHKYYLMKNLHADYIPSIDKYRSPIRVDIDCNLYDIPLNNQLNLLSNKSLSYDDITRIIINYPCKPYEVYMTDNIINIVYIEFIKLIEANVKIRKCHNCNKYFTLSNNRSDKIYCDRISPIGGKTCSKIGAELKYNKTLETDYIEKEYRKATKRLNFHLSKSPGREADEEYRDWLSLAREKKDKVKKGELTENDFINWLDTTTKKRKQKGTKNNG